MIRQASTVMIACTMLFAACSVTENAVVETDEEVDTSIPDVAAEAPAETTGDIPAESDAEPDEFDVDEDDMAALLEGVTDDELAAVLAQLTEEEFDQLLDELDGADFDRVLAALDASDEPAEPAAAPVEPAAGEPTDEPTDAPGGPLTADQQEILAELLANGFCDPADIEDGGVVTAMHFVVDGQVQPPCSGEPDPRLDAAWQAMADVTPTTLIDDISLLAGFEGCDTCETLAFVTTLDEAAEFFLMAIDVQAGADDLDELALTMQHELTHVFTQDPTTQLDLALDADSCTTYYNGAGCFRDGAYAWEWIQQFWDAEALATIPDDGGVNEEAGVDRCQIDAPFTGSYGASNPEEDMAEVFSAYVFDVDVNPALAEKLAFFDQYPELRIVRDNAEQLGRWDGNYSFETC